MHDDPAVPRSWMVDLHSWIIQDGNYPDFVTGQRTDFAVEFASRGGLKRLDDVGEVSVRRIEGPRYEVTAQIVYDEPNAQVIDFGILVYRFIGIEDPEHQSHVGAWVTGEIVLGVDPFFYFDELAHEDGFPALIYTWTVQEVLERTRGSATQDGTDHVDTGGSPDLVRIERTDAWGDVHRSPSYVLRCRLEPAPRSAVRSLDNR